MATKKDRQARVQAFVREILAAEETAGFDGRGENINDIELGMIEIGNMVAREFGAQKLAAHASEVCEDPRCPRCGSPGKYLKEQTRDLITSRGKVPVTEAKYRCPKCRRLFFPSDLGIGA